MSVIERRYVKALWDLAENDQEKSEFKKWLNEIGTLFANNSEFSSILNNPLIVKEEKLEVVKKIFPEYNSKTFENFLNILIETKRIRLIEDISEEYSKMLEEANNEMSIKIITSMEIDKEQIEKILNKYKKIYNVDKINYDLLIDKSILGGFKVIVGNTIYDNSVKTQIEGIF